MCNAVTPREGRGNFHPYARGYFLLLTLLDWLGETEQQTANTCNAHRL